MVEFAGTGEWKNASYSELETILDMLDSRRIDREGFAHERRPDTFPGAVIQELISLFSMARATACDLLVTFSFWNTCFKW